MDSLTDILRTPTPAFPAEEITKTVALLKEEVLWSGLSALPAPELVDAPLMIVLGGVLAFIGIVMLMFCLRLKEMEGSFLGTGLGGLALIAGLVIAVAGWVVEPGEALRRAQQGYIITDKRIVVLRMDAQARVVRDDYTTAGVGRVTRTPDGRIGINIVHGPYLTMQGKGDDHARLERAAERLIDAKGSGGELVRDGLGKS